MYYGKGFTRMATEEEVLASLPVPVCMPEPGNPLPAQFTNWVPQQYQIWCGRPEGLQLCWETESAGYKS